MKIDLLFDPFGASWHDIQEGAIVAEGEGFDGGTLSVKLEAAGHAISPPTVGRLLRKLDYSLHVNAKKTEAASNHPGREQQFDYIAVQRATFTAAGLPIISTDTKKKELVGDFKNAGKTWSLEPIAVNVHDYPHDALGRAVPYGAAHEVVFNMFW